MPIGYLKSCAALANCPNTTFKRRKLLNLHGRTMEWSVNRGQCGNRVIAVGYLSRMVFICRRALVFYEMQSWICRTYLPGSRNHLMLRTADSSLNCGGYEPCLGSATN